MKSITRAFSAVACSTIAYAAVVFTGTVLAPSAAVAATPFSAAIQAERGQLDGIPGYQRLQSALHSGSISGEDILKAAGLEVNASDANFVESILLNPSN
ncbi:MAG: hypothetical protein HC824_12885 [Synechococcales cyanobacterium RM1_1_8]|nr:hypothetical protein [Synechococcales cyanobacterium RM1_1_8]